MQHVPGVVAGNVVLQGPDSLGKWCQGEQFQIEPLQVVVGQGRLIVESWPDSSRRRRSLRILPDNSIDVERMSKSRFLREVAFQLSRALLVLRGQATTRRLLSRLSLTRIVKYVRKQFLPFIKEHQIIATNFSPNLTKCCQSQIRQNI